MSMQAAMGILNLGPCYHMRENLHNDHSDLWIKLGTLARGDPDRPPWSSVFRGYRSTMDFPGFLFYQELMEVYPDAKVVLTIRDSEKWYTSVADTIRNVMPDTCSFLGMRLMGTLVPKWGRTTRMVATLLGERFNHGDNSKESWICNFKKHNEEVQRLVPRERLLVYQVGEGWEPLCKFLGVPVPDVPFPHLNDTAQFRGRMQMMNIVAYVMIGCMIALGLFLVYRLLSYLF